jgi:hypothetical protein
MGTVMTRYGQIGWRLAAMAAAFVGTAALAVTLTRAPIGSDAALSSEVTGRACPTSGLEAWLGAAAGPAATAASARTGTGRRGMPTTAGTYYTLEFTNISHRACSLYGYPEVSAYADNRTTSGIRGGRMTAGQIGSAAIRDTSVRPQPVLLAPGATAHSVLRVAAVGRTDPAACAQVTAQELRVTPPHQGRSAFVPVHIPVCSQKGHASLSVQAIQARAGVPGYPTLP